MVNPFQDQLCFVVGRLDCDTGSRLAPGTTWQHTSKHGDPQRPDGFPNVHARSEPTWRMHHNTGLSATNPPMSQAACFRFLGSTARHHACSHPLNLLLLPKKLQMTHLGDQVRESGQFHAGNGRHRVRACMILAGPAARSVNNNNMYSCSGRKLRERALGCGPPRRRRQDACRPHCCAFSAATCAAWSATRCCSTSNSA